MNEKFFDLKKEKQDRFINAALKLFAENGYRKASTDEIVRQAGISKGLLFHYFGSKQGLYEFVYQYSTKYIRMEQARVLPADETDFFEIERLLETAKRNIMYTYPYMYVFVNRAFREEDATIVQLVAESMDAYSAALADVYARADLSRFKEKIDPSAVLKMCIFIADGILNEQFRDGNIRADDYLEEMTRYLLMLKENLCR